MLTDVNKPVFITELQNRQPECKQYLKQNHVCSLSSVSVSAEVISSDGKSIQILCKKKKIQQNKVKALHEYHQYQK